MKPELLAPAGDLERLKIALLYGADAVYIGGKIFGLRANAINFSSEEMKEAVTFAHSLNKKVYVTVNMVLHNKEIKFLLDYLKELESIGIDAIIASDLSVISLALEKTNLEVHVSTQQSTLNYEAVKYLKDLGVKRVVLGRELSSEEIKNIQKVGLDIEIFIHGAICFSYSGRCFLSDFMTGRSANLGDCAQSCRWSYNLYAEEKNNPGELMPIETNEYGTSIFSSKDLCLLKEIPDIIDMGIDSLKVEGRLKTEYYIASVINAYRNAIDDYINSPEEYDYTKYLKELEKVKTRGLTTFYFNDRENKDIQEYAGKQYNEQYEFGGKVVEYGEEKSIIEIRNRLKIGDEMEIIIPHQIEPVKFTIEKLWDAETDEEIDVVNPGKQGQQVKLKLPIECKKDWIIRRKK